MNDKQSVRMRAQRPMLIAAIVALVGTASYLAYWRHELSVEASSAAPSDPAGSLQRTPPFDVSNAIIPQSEILPGGPPKDGIPSLTSPLFVSRADAKFMDDEDRVIGVSRGNEAKAYPLKIMDWHEAVNDTVDGLPMAVTYCPLCDSAAVFDRRLPDRIFELGVSGWLYNSNVLLYDRGAAEGESLWSQLMRKSVSGPAVQQRLQPLPLELTTWSD